MEEMRNAYVILVGKPEGKKPLGRRRFGWEDDMNMDLQEIRCKDVGWIHLAQWRTVVNTVMNIWIP
jgi:hypothetical protein